MSHPDARVEMARREVVAAMGKLEELFSPGVHLTFLMRHPTNPECEMLITSDDPVEIVQAIERAKARQEIR